MHDADKGAGGASAETARRPEAVGVDSDWDEW